MTANLLYPLLHLISFYPLLPVLGPEPGPMALFRQWSRSPSPDLRLQAARSLHGHRGSDSRAALLSLLDDAHPAVRNGVRAELIDRPPEEGPELAHDIAALRSGRARVEGLRVILARREDPTLFATDKDSDVRARALFSGRIGLPLLRDALRHPDGLTRALALERLSDSAEVAAHVSDRAEEVRIAVARMTDDGAILARLLEDRSWRVKLAAMQGADRLRPTAAIPGLIECVAKEEGRIRARALRTLEELTGAAFGPDAPAWRKWWKQVGSGFTPLPPRPPRGPETTTALIRFRRLPVESLRLAFVLDASRSMSKPSPGADGKTRWELVVHDLSEIVGRLPSAARFNVVLFRTEVEAWKPRLVPASSGARRACVQWIDQASPAGWTNLFDALALALADDELDALYVLTDGVPSRGAETKRQAIMDEIEFLNHYRLVQINCVQAGGAEGLGKSWDGFLADLAAAHDGISVRE